VANRPSAARISRRISASFRDFGNDFVHVVGNEARRVDAGFGLGLDQLDRRRVADDDETEIVTIAGRADSRRFSAKIL